MLDVFGFRIIDLELRRRRRSSTRSATCINPCLNPVAFGVNWGVPEVDHRLGRLAVLGLSLLAIISALLQLVQSRMALPAADPAMADDPNTRIQRQMAFLSRSSR